MDTISAIQPETPPLGAWYLVTPEGLSSVKITDGLTFAEEETHEGRQLALVPGCAAEGLIRFRVDASGIWLTVCDSHWQLSGAEGVVLRPFPIFRPVDLCFRDSVVHLRPDFSGVAGGRAIELTLEPVPEGPRPLMSRNSIRQLQTQLNESRQTHAALAAVAAVPDERPAETPRAETPRAQDPLAVISPLPEPGFRKIAGKGRPSSIRLIPDPAPRDEIPLLTDPLSVKMRAPVPVSRETDAARKRPVSLKDVILSEPRTEPRTEPQRPSAGSEAKALVTEAAPGRKQAAASRPGKVRVPAPRYRSFASAVLFAFSLLMVSMDVPDISEFPDLPDLPDLPELPDLPGLQDLLEFYDEGGAPAATEATDEQGMTTGPAVTTEPTGQSDTSRQLMTAVEALLESKSPTDPVTRQFVEDAIRAINEAEATGSTPDTPPESAE